MLETELQNRVRFAQQIAVADMDGKVWIHHSRLHGRVEQSTDKPVAEVFSGMEQITETLISHSEFVDAANREVYATRLELDAGESALALLLISKPFDLA